MLAVAALSAVAAGCSSDGDKPAHSASRGALDLQGWSFDRDGDVPLGGEWSFFPGRLLAPEQAEKAAGESFASVPSSWNSYPASYGFKDGQGFATFRLNVRIDPTDRILGLRVPNIFSAYKLWVNGRLLASEGRVGTSRATSSAEQYPRIVSFDGKTKELQIVVQVSNFQHRKGGIWVDFRLGDSDALVRNQTRESTQSMVILGSLLIIGIYHIGLYAFRRQERFTVYFGLLCLFVALRSSVTGEAYLIQLFPVSWETGIKLEYISLPLSVVTGYLYVYHLFPLDASRRAIKAITAIGAVLTVFVLASPTIVFSRALPVFQLFVLAVAAYVLFVLVAARLRKREGSAFVLAGIAVFVLTIMNDMLFYNEWLSYAQLVPLGLFFFMLMQSFIISTRFSSALHRVEQVSAELRELNVHLEERIEERTEELRMSNETLERANIELGRMETSRRHLMTNISHDLRTPITLLQGYLEAIQDGVVKTEEQRQRYVRMMLGKVEGLARLIRDLFELSKLEARQLRFDKTEVRLSDWMARICEQYEIDVRSAGLAFACSYDGNAGETPDEGNAGVHTPGEPDGVVLELDLPRMDQVMANLIYNAIKHSGTEGKIEILFRREPGAGRLVVTVSDTGKGIEAEHLPFIFDRFYKKESSRNSADGGSGLGLAIAREIVEAHGGTIGAASVPGKGTDIVIELPVAPA